MTSSNHHQPNPNNISNKSSFAQQVSSLWPEPLPSTPIETRPFEIYHLNHRNVYATICNRLLLFVAIAEMRPGAFSIGMIPTCTDRRQECARIIGQGYQSTEYKRYQHRWQRPRLRGGQEGASGHILPVPQLYAHDEVGRHKSFAADARPCCCVMPTCDI